MLVVSVCFFLFFVEEFRRFKLPVICLADYELCIYVFVIFIIFAAEGFFRITVLFGI